MIKFLRNYQLRYIFADNTFIDVFLPITIKFRVERNNFNSTNTGHIEIYNLDPHVRNQMRQDWADYAKIRRVVLSVGYGTEQLSVIANMIVTRSFSVREGIDFITHIECCDGAAAYTQAVVPFTSTYTAPVTQGFIIRDQIKQLNPYSVAIGAISTYYDDQTYDARDQSYAGNSICDFLNEMVGDAFFIDNGKANVLRDNEYIIHQANPFLISAQTGLLGTPTREELYVNFEMIMEPKLLVGSLIQLDSLTGDTRALSNNNYQIAGINGQYVVHTLHHEATISEAVCGDAITSIGCYKTALIGVHPEAIQ